MKAEFISDLNELIHRKVGYGRLSIDGDEKSFIPENK
jgi:hypothetical protein